VSLINYPTVVAGHISQAEILKRDGCLVEAIACYREAIQLAPESPALYHHLGKALQEFGSLTEAIACYQNAIRLQPDFEPAYYPLRYLPLASDSPLWQDLIDFYNQIIETGLELSLVYGNLADALTKQGKLEGAIANYRKAVYYQTITAYPALTNMEWDFERGCDPNFIIIGAPRCGTTSLYRYLTSHPQVLPAAEKEVRFFSQCFKYGLTWYLAHFPPIPPTVNTANSQDVLLTGEATPTYFDHPLAAQRLAEFFPKIKLILLLRDPTDRAISHYYMNVRRGTEKRTLAEAIETEMELLKNLSETDMGTAWLDCPYLRKSIYIWSLREWQKHFPLDQFLILRSENFYSSPSDSLKQVFDFLGLPNHPLPRYPKYNGWSYPPTSQEIRQTLVEYFQPYERQLESKSVSPFP
jgi:tetratricopeptide (TPR) repeat protein